MLLTRIASGATKAPRQLVHVSAGHVGAKPPTMDRRTFLKRSGLVAGAGAFASQLPVRRDRQGRRRRRSRRQGRSQAHGVHALLGRLLGRRGRRERRLDPPGAGVRFAAQPRRALRQGRLGARARHARALASAEVADEARRRQVAEDVAGTQAINEVGDQLLAIRNERQGRSRRGVLDRQLQAQQRAVVSDAQVRVVLGHQQLRPPGAHLPLDDGRRRSQHLGLRRDDQLVQRHAEHASARCTSARTPPRRTRCRCCTCCTPRRPAPG